MHCHSTRTCQQGSTRHWRRCCLSSSIGQALRTRPHGRWRRRRQPRRCPPRCHCPTRPRWTSNSPCRRFRSRGRQRARFPRRLRSPPNRCCCSHELRQCPFPRRQRSRPIRSRPLCRYCRHSPAPWRRHPLRHRHHLLLGNRRCRLRAQEPQNTESQAKRKIHRFSWKLRPTRRGRRLYMPKRLATDRPNTKKMTTGRLPCRRLRRESPTRLCRARSCLTIDRPEGNGTRAVRHQAVVSGGGPTSGRLAGVTAHARINPESTSGAMCSLYPSNRLLLRLRPWRSSSSSIETRRS